MGWAKLVGLVEVRRWSPAQGVSGVVPKVVVVVVVVLRRVGVGGG